MIWLLVLFACWCAESGSDESLVSLFRRLDTNRALSASEIDRLAELLDVYHRQTTLHCDEVWRRSSADGLRFTGPGEHVRSGASVADVVVAPDGAHVIVYNDTRPGLLIDTLRRTPDEIWARGLIGYGGLGLSRNLHGTWEELPLDLELTNVQEAVDPDLGLRPDGSWRLVWFGVEPADMNPEQHGPLASAKPHNFYRSQSASLGHFPEPIIAISSNEGTTGGADPTVLDLEDGSEILYVGPLDHTAMGWTSVDGLAWASEDPPDFDTQVRAATPDAVRDPAGGYRLYYMVNGFPGQFGMARSSDGIEWSEQMIVMEDGDAFNISVSVDPSGRWWAYYNRTDEDCLAQWGSRRILPGQGAESPAP